jgi:signal transduction histidine kinase
MKLLDKSLRSSVIYASVILLIAIPVLYGVVHSIVTEEINEGLYAKKKQLTDRLVQAGSQNEKISFYDPDIQIDRSNGIIKDRLYHIRSYDSVSQEYIPYRVLEGSIQVHQNIYRVRIKNSLVDRDDLIISIVSIIGGLIVLVIIGLLVINRYLSRQIWKPFYGTLEQLKQFRLDTKSALHLPPSGIDEFNNLNSTLQDLTGNSRKTYATQREFTENASHEMQTPLAILHGHLDLLLGSQPLTEEQAELINRMQQVTGRMNKLNKTLVLLARIDNNQFPKTELINLATLIEKAIRQFEEPVSQKKIMLVSHLDNRFTLSANRDLIEILVSNLLANAIRHNHTEGQIRIETKEHSLLISNSGQKDPLNEQFLYKRFQKQGGSNDSPGLGLAIVSRICEVSGYSIQYKFNDAIHTFEITFW